MADESYDAVIVGGGTKSMVTAIYLAKYAGMSVGVFEERRELCHGLTSEQGCVPGFVADYHASLITSYNWEPVWDDFPDFEEKGGKVVQGVGNVGAINVDNQSCWVQYNYKVDPTQERTAAGLAKFATERDAETYLKIWELFKPGSDLVIAQLQDMFNPPPPFGQPSPVEKWFANYLSQPDCLIDASWFNLPVYNALERLWESPAFRYFWLRLFVFAGFFTDLTPAIAMFLFPFFLSREVGSVQGGTHNVAHAYQRILYENGGKWFPFSKVDKIIIENGQAKGVQLADGSRIEAKKVVVSGVNVKHLCFDLLGKDFVSPKILKKLDTVIGNIKGLAWYTWFLHELPKYKAADIDPDIVNTSLVTLGRSDTRSWWDAMALRRMGKNPPVEGKLLAIHHSAHDKTRSPEGKHVVLTDFDIVTATFLSEREWLKFKKTHAEEALADWQKYAPNMTWDNVIGFAPQTPYDAAGRGRNFWPDGNPGPFDLYEGQYGRVGPIVELSGYKVPEIKNLYATGGWKATTSSCQAGYACYKVIAEELDLPKPWKDKGRPY
jgi:phytoene dehydrogenase-like protein